MGAELVAGGGATVRAWAPRAGAVYVNGTFGGTARNGQTDDLLMAKDSKGYWTGFLPDARDGDPYLFFVVGAGIQRFQARSVRKRNVNGCKIPELQLRDPAGKIISMARFGFCDAGLF
jgi:Carbohydrate-binding module 48 (Isoamylase N-terminal domain)